jgi:hypothetical protein
MIILTILNTFVSAKWEMKYLLHFFRIFIYLPLKPPLRPRLSPLAASPTSRNVAIAALKLSSRNFPYKQNRKCFEKTNQNKNTVSSTTK